MGSKKITTARKSRDVFRDAWTWVIHSILANQSQNELQAVVPACDSTWIADSCEHGTWMSSWQTLQATAYLYKRGCSSFALPVWNKHQNHIEGNLQWPAIKLRRAWRHLTHLSFDFVVSFLAHLKVTAKPATLCDSLQTPWKNAWNLVYILHQRTCMSNIPQKTELGINWSIPRNRHENNSSTEQPSQIQPQQG